MPVRGRPAKPEGQRINRVPLQHGFVNVPDAPYKPTAAEAKCPVKDAPAETVAMWKALSTMPHCRLWQPADWEFARTSALVHATVVTSGGTKGLTSWLMMAKTMGFTWDSRQGQRLRYQDAAPESEPAKAGEPAKPIAIDKVRRERLLKAGNEE